MNLNLENLLPYLAGTMGWLLWLITTIIQFLQLRHALPEIKNNGSHINCSNRSGVYRAHITLQPNYMAPNLFPFSLIAFGAGPIRIPLIKSTSTELVYHTEDGEPYSVPPNKWTTDRSGYVRIDSRFLAANRIRKLSITAHQGFTQEEINAKVNRRVVSDDLISDWTHRIVFEVRNTNDVYQLYNYQLTLNEIPSNCREAKFLKASENRASGADFAWKHGSHPVLTIPNMKPHEIIEVTCEYSS